MVAVGPLGIGKRRQSRQGAAVRRYAGGGTGEGERCNRGSGAPHRARLTDRGGAIARSRGADRDQASCDLRRRFSTTMKSLHVVNSKTFFSPNRDKNGYNKNRP